MSRYAAVHREPQGPGDARPTALQVVEDEGMHGKLVGMTILITGGSSGIGVETARALYETGAKVFITSRNMSQAEEVVKDISTDSSRRPLSIIEMALDSLASVRTGAQQFLQQSDGKCNIFICNAGVMGPGEGRTADGFETQFGTNHLSHFLLFQLLKPALLASATSSFGSRVVVVSSSGHRISGIKPDNYNLEGAYDPWVGYGQSKTANIYFANEIERRYGARGLHGLSLHPGAMPGTGLGRHADPVRLKAMRGDPLYAKTSKSVPQGAATTVWASIGKTLEGEGFGKFLDDVQIAQPAAPDSKTFSPGYAPHAYDEEMAKTLWSDSHRLVGSKDED